MSGPAKPATTGAAIAAAAFANLRAAAGEGEPLHLPIAAIDEDPGQPRSTFDADDLAALAASITAHGVVQPVIVRPPVAGRYRLVVGARRLRAAKLAGLTDIPALLRPGDGAGFAAQLVENQQRVGLCNSELAAAIARLTAAGHTVAQIAVLCALKDYQVAAFRQVERFPPALRRHLDRADIRALYDLYRQWCHTPEALVAALPADDTHLGVTEARRIIARLTGRPSGSLVLEPPPADGQGGAAGSHGARPRAAAPVFLVAAADGRPGRLVVDRRARQPGAALVAYETETREVEAATLRIIAVA
ncbi:ParB/RepB/Spo0J family partition protein [Azospirillum picis]|uniref:ParB family chromosome partitioning protein n=1 Tax=Azospirillum picis TaxID=488438 RepID=A0ABU0MU91_9PROT|nr:ParB/RepB/Spo0J family partition protein [Azospirillum picis]MBP2300926.1 ParB family chromosome partitioning protein [Azospirillum picis]MDQ0537030.1 ParB family chromosome partitioning protein [Azospirillum picis]